MTPKTFKFYMDKDKIILKVYKRDILDIASKELLKSE